MHLPVQILYNSKLRISPVEFARLTKALSELMQDEAIGLLAVPQPIGSFNLSAKAALSSLNVRESLLTWRDCVNFFYPSVQATACLSGQGGFITFSCTKNTGVKDEHITETLMSGCHRYHCWLAGEFVPIEKVDLNYSGDKLNQDRKFVFYGAPISYGRDINALYFDRKSLELPCLRSKKELDIFIKNPGQNLLTQARRSKSLVMSLRYWMERSFRESQAKITMARAGFVFGMSEQTLRRRLHEEAYSFQELKDIVRRDLAVYYITQTKTSIEEVAFSLGFADASTFIRSFKRWTGLTPLSYRKL